MSIAKVAPRSIMLPQRAMPPCARHYYHLVLIRILKTTEAGRRFILLLKLLQAKLLRSCSVRVPLQIYATCMAIHCSRQPYLVQKATVPL